MAVISLDKGIEQLGPRILHNRDFSALVKVRSDPFDSVGFRNVMCFVFRPTGVGQKH